MVKPLRLPCLVKPPLSRFEKIRRFIYMFVIIIGLLNIFFPVIANAGTDVFNNDIQDVYVKITENVDEANEVLQKAFQFAQVSPYTVINMSSQTTVANAIIAGSRTLALIVSVLLLMVDFFRKTVNFEWSSKWENVLVFLIKIVVVKQVVQNADVIIGYIYSAFSTLNRSGTTPNFLPAGNRVTYTISIAEDLLNEVFNSDHWYQGWIKYWQNLGAGLHRHDFTYEISKDAVRMFYPHAAFPDAANLKFEDHAFGNPTQVLSFTPTLEILFWQPYFLVMKAIAYIIFVISMSCRRSFMQKHRYKRCVTIWEPFGSCSVLHAAKQRNNPFMTKSATSGIARRILITDCANTPDGVACSKYSTPNLVATQICVNGCKSC